MSRTWRRQFGSLVTSLLVSLTTGWILKNGPHRSHLLHFHQVYHASFRGTYIDSTKPTQIAEVDKALDEFPPPASCRLSGRMLAVNDGRDTGGDSSTDDTLKVLHVLALIAVCTTSLATISPVSAPWLSIFA